MKIVLDLQALQSASMYRGIGRYSNSFAKALLRNAGSHEIFILLNHYFLKSIGEIKSEFLNIIDPDNFIVWESPTPTIAAAKNNYWRRKAAEYLQDYYLKRIRPDVLHISSFFEGFYDEVVTPMPPAGRRDYQIAVTLYDLIPYFEQKDHLFTPLMRQWYGEKINDLKKADLLFAISEHTKKDAMQVLNTAPEKIINVSCDTGPEFKKINIGEKNRKTILDRYGISRDFILYTGAADKRKNIKSLVNAYALLPGSIRDNYQLVLVYPFTSSQKREILKYGKSGGIIPSDIVFTGYVPDKDLVALYNICKLFVYPSLYEGFGLPVLEAMRCGAPVICSDRTSLPEVVGNQEALFDPLSPEDIRDKIMSVMTDETYRKKLQEHARKQADKFSWDNSARLALRALEVSSSETGLTNIFKPGAIRPKLVYVTCLDNGTGELYKNSKHIIDALTPFYTIKVIPLSGKNDFDPGQIKCAGEGGDSQETNAGGYSRIVYDINNTESLRIISEYMEYYPGVIIVHDGVELVSPYPPGSGEVKRAYCDKELFLLYGYKVCMERIEKGVDNYCISPGTFKIFSNATGVITGSRKVADDMAGIPGGCGEGGDIFSGPGVDIITNAPNDRNKTGYSYYHAIEKHHLAHRPGVRAELIKKITELPGRYNKKTDIVKLARCISEAEIKFPYRPQLFVDISQLVLRDAKSGIQRVVKGILNNVLYCTNTNIRVEPVFRKDGIYRYARKFSFEFYGLPDTSLEDLPIEVNPGDIFLGLDLDAGIDVYARGFIKHHVNRGMKLYHVLYDLLPANHREWFEPSLADDCASWLKHITKMSDGIICISNAVKMELVTWLNSNSVKRYLPLKLAYFHLGADMDESYHNAAAVPAAEPPEIKHILNKDYLIMIGTVEPRKGHEQTLKAFEILWQDNRNLALVIIGREGWMVSKLSGAIRKHPELGKRLFWLESCPDHSLKNLLMHSQAFLMASMGEGFGLPLIEASRYNIPIISRDLPVFREVAGANAYYFKGMSGGELASSILEWTALQKENRAPSSSGLNYLTWRDSTARLMQIVSNDQWDYVWEPDLKRKDEIYDPYK